MPGVEDAAHSVRLASPRWALDEVERHPLRIRPRYASKVRVTQVRACVLNRLQLAEIVLSVQHGMVPFCGHLLWPDLLSRRLLFGQLIRFQDDFHDSRLRQGQQGIDLSPYGDQVARGNQPPALRSSCHRLRRVCPTTPQRPRVDVQLHVQALPAGRLPHDGHGHREVAPGSAAPARHQLDSHPIRSIPCPRRLPIDQHHQ
mmetsp:Transcript_6815/g.17411  ORF Transcript_6815/g.17411 Transcript_6815/m.17411 type:complete len:201 (+) Transcript_6815:1215-1817(+)